MQVLLLFDLPERIARQICDSPKKYCILFALKKQ